MHLGMKTSPNYPVNTGSKSYQHRYWTACWWGSFDLYCWKSSIKMT